MADDYIAVLYALSEKMAGSIQKLANAGLMSKAPLAQIVINELFETTLLQNELINKLTYELTKVKKDILSLKERAGI